MRVWLLALVVLQGCTLANPPGSPPKPAPGTMSCRAASNMETSAHGWIRCRPMTAAEAAEAVEY